MQTVKSKLCLWAIGVLRCVALCLWYFWYTYLHWSDVMCVQMCPCVYTSACIWACLRVCVCACVCACNTVLIPYGRKYFGRKIFWQIAEIMTFGGIYFGGWESLSHNDIHSKMANRTHWEFNWAMMLVSLDHTTPTGKQRTGCRSSSVSGWQLHQCRSLQRPRTHRLDCVSKPTLLPPSGVQNPL